MNNEELQIKRQKIAELEMALTGFTADAQAEDREISDGVIINALCRVAGRLVSVSATDTGTRTKLLSSMVGIAQAAMKDEDARQEIMLGAEEDE